jgi:hypothetical protein
VKTAVGPCPGHFTLRVDSSHRTVQRTLKTQADSRCTDTVLGWSSTQLVALRRQEERAERAAALETEAAMQAAADWIRDNDEVNLAELDEEIARLQAEKAKEEQEEQEEVSGLVSVARQWLLAHQAEEEARAQGTWRPTPGGPRAADADPEAAAREARAIAAAVEQVRCDWALREQPSLLQRISHQIQHQSGRSVDGCRSMQQREGCRSLLQADDTPRTAGALEALLTWVRHLLFSQSLTKQCPRATHRSAWSARRWSGGGNGTRSGASRKLRWTRERRRS